MRANDLQKAALTALILCLILSITACGSRKPQSNMEPLQEGDASRDFTVQLMDGSTFQLSAQQGKAVLLNFWSTTCGPCVAEMPAFPRLMEKYGDKLSLIAVNSGEGRDTVEHFLEENGYTFPVALDEEWEISSLYPSDGIPYTLIIAPDGTVSSIQLGASTADEMFEHYCAQLDRVLP